MPLDPCADLDTFVWTKLPCVTYLLSTHWLVGPIHHHLLLWSFSHGGGWSSLRGLRRRSFLSPKPSTGAPTPATGPPRPAALGCSYRWPPFGLALAHWIAGGRCGCGRAPGAKLRAWPRPASRSASPWHVPPRWAVRHPPSRMRTMYLRSSKRTTTSGSTHPTQSSQYSRRAQDGPPPLICRSSASSTGRAGRSARHHGRSTRPPAENSLGEELRRPPAGSSLGEELHRPSAIRGAEEKDDGEELGKDWRRRRWRTWPTSQWVERSYVAEAFWSIWK
jgi:hypothetical protein